MKKNLIFLHGGPGFRDYLEPYFSELGSDFNCVFYDQQRGPGIQILDLIDQLNLIVSELDGPIILIGHSWGGILAIEYAGKYPQRIEGVVLMSTGLCTSHWRDDYYAERKRLGLDDSPPEDIYLAPDERVLGKPMLDKTWETFSEETFESLASSYVETYDVREMLGRIQVTILNIFGERDVRFPRQVPLSFRALNSRVIDLEISGAGHFPFLKPQDHSEIIHVIRERFTDPVPTLGKAASILEEKSRLFVICTPNLGR